jgi:predicted dehydrogenase
MGQTLRIGVVGTGGLGTELGEEALEVEDVRVVGLADVSEDSLAAAGETLGVSEERRFTDWEDMFATTDLDAVIVATPHTLHYDQITAAMDRGLHVLCEKPLTTDLEHARTLRDRAAESEQTLMVGYQRHLEAPYVAARERIQDGPTPKILTASITQRWIDQFRDAWRTDPDLSGGGQLYDSGSHLLDAVLWTTDLTPTAVSAELVFDDDARAVDTQAVLSVTFEEGAVGSVTVSGDTPAVREHVHVWSDDGGTYVDMANWSDVEVTAIAPDGSESTPDTDDTTPTKVAAFVESIRNGEEPPATAADAFKVTAVTEAAYESARTGERIEIEW